MALNKKLYRIALFLMVGVAGEVSQSNLIYGAQKNVPYKNQKGFHPPSDQLDTSNLNHKEMHGMDCWIYRVDNGYQVNASNNNGQVTLSNHRRDWGNRSREDYDALVAAREAMRSYKSQGICNSGSNESVWTDEMINDENAKKDAAKERRAQEREDEKSRDAQRSQESRERQRQEAAAKEAAKLPAQW